MQNVMRVAEAARLLGLSASTLNKFRLSGLGPPFIRLGSRAVGYRLSDIEIWLDARRRTSTSDIGETTP